MPDLLALPAGAEVQDAHGLELDVEGNIYLTYRNWNDGIVNNGTDRNCLIRWDPQGLHGTFLAAGGDALCTGKPHGIKIAHERDNATGKLNSFFYMANVETGIPGTAHPNGATAINSGKLTKTTLSGAIVWQINGTFGQPEPTSYRPSWWAVNQPGDYIYLTDGYGSFNIYLFNRDGKFMNKTFGGPGQSHGHFTNPHAITYDVRSKLLAVSDRGNHRIEFYNFDNSKVGNETFDYVKSVAFPGAAYPELSGFLPCNFRVLENATDPADDGFVVVPALEGPVAILDRNNSVVSVVDVGKLIGDLGSKHPHDAILLQNGDLVVGTWDPGYVSYWKRLPPQ